VTDLHQPERAADTGRFSQFSAARGVFVREIRLAARSGSGISLVVGFYIFVIVMLPFGLGTDLELLARIGPAVLWIGLALALLMTFDRLFQQDFEDGTLDTILLSPFPLEAVVFVKCLVHWLSHGAPLLLISPFLAVLLNVPWPLYGPLLITIAAGSSGLVFAGAIGAALSAALRRAGLLTALFVLPLYVPIVIFAVGYVNSVRDQLAFGIEASPQGLLLLAAYSLFLMALAPLASAAALRANMS